MDSRTRKRKLNSQKIRCAYSGKIVNPSKDVVLVENAIEYVRKMGYMVSIGRFILKERDDKIN